MANPIRWWPVLLVLTACSGSRIEVDAQGNVLTSSGFPPVTLTVNDAFQYLGKDRFVLYGTADAEIHLFGELDEGRVRRLLWIQFEGYLPSRIFSWYDYGDSPRRTEIGGAAYFDDVWPWELGAAKVRPGSDTERVLELLLRNNLSLGPEVMALRLVRLDEAARNELMIVYAEDLRDHEWTVAELSEGGSSRQQWMAISQQLRERALASFSVSEMGATGSPGNPIAVR